MAPTNEFLTFCPTDTGTNLLTESEYSAATDRTSGNKPGVASAKLNNKALRQANAVASQLAQMVSNQLSADVLDDGSSARLLSQFLATLKPYAPNVTVKTSGSGTFGLTQIFFIATGNATAGATYTNNTHTFTVVETVASGTEIKMTGTGFPSVSGILTKASGTGDATLTFYATRKPLAIYVQMVGGGGGGGGGDGTDVTPSGAGGDTTFDVMTAGGGLGAPNSQSKSALGGTASLGSGPVGVAQGGSAGHSQTVAVGGGANAGGNGGTSPFGGAGWGSNNNSPGTGGSAVGYGSGGGGGGAGSGNGSGGGGGAGGYVNAQIAPVSDASFSYAVGAGGSGGVANNTGGNGGGGVIIVTECYQ